MVLGGLRRVSCIGGATFAKLTGVVEVATGIRSSVFFIEEYIFSDKHEKPI